MLYELHGQIVPFCKKYDNYTCTSIEKTEDDVIIAICTPSKAKQNNNDENEQKDESPVLPSHAIQPVAVAKYIQVLPDIYTQQTEIRTTTQTDTQSETTSIAQCAEGLKQFFDDLLTRIERNPDLLIKPVEEFIKNYQNINKDIDIANSLQTFAQYPDVAMAITRGLKRKPTGDPTNLEPAIVLAKKRKSARRRLITAKVQPPASSQSSVSNQTDASQGQYVTSHQLPQLPQDYKVVDNVVSSHEGQTQKIAPETQDVMNHEISVREIPSHRVLTLAHDMSAHHGRPHAKVIPGHEMVHQVSAVAHGMPPHHRVLSHEMSIHGIPPHKASHDYSTHGIASHKMPVNDGLSIHGISPHKLSVHARSPHKVPLHEASHKVSVLEVLPPQVSMW